MPASLPSLSPERIAALPKKDKALLVQLLDEQKRRQSLKTSTVVGFVCPEKGLTHSVRWAANGWEDTTDTPDVYLPAKLERAALSRKRFIVIIGGRGCYPAGTEFMTRDGWRKIEDYRTGEEVLTWDRKTKRAYYAKPEAYIDLPVDQFYTIQNAKVDFTTSSSHRHIMRNEKTGRLDVLTTDEIVRKHSTLARGVKHKLIRTFDYGGAGVAYTDDYIRLKIAVIADGHFPNVKSRHVCRVNLKRERKIIRLKMLLEANGIAYQERVNPDGFHVFHFNMDNKEKEFESYWYKCSKAQLQVFCDEVLKWDGCILEREDEGKVPALGFASVSKKTIDFTQFAFHAVGQRADITVTYSDRYRGGLLYSLCVSRHHTESSISIDRSAASTTEIWEAPSEDGRMYCFTTETGYFVVRQKGKIYVSGNSTKSVSAGDISLIDARDNGAKTYCLREYQSSIKNSVHSLLKEEIERLEFEGFEVLQNSIHYKGRDCFEFAGLARNVDSIKSAYGFKRFLIEESQSLSSESLRALTPTARAKPNKGLPVQFKEITPLEQIQEAVSEDGVSLMFVANPASSEDPFSKRFIVPFLTELEANGFYEDDLHLIVVMNYMDNPWFMESGLDAERLWDYEHLDRALYDHIWLGKFNDSVESALIKAEWFDACVDAHIKLGFQPKGAKIASHDPSDEGKDTKGYAMRHGVVFLDVQEKKDGNVNDGGHWAADVAIKQGVDAFSWDGGGMGAGLAEQMGVDFKGKKVQLSVYNGAMSPDAPDAIYKPALESPVANQKTNEQTFYNMRAQYHWDFRDRVYRTYRAVVHREYTDPDKLISFSSSIPLLSKLRAEACRIPIKPNTNGMNTLYTKEEMRVKFKIPSPNLFDSAVQTLRHIPVNQIRPVMPQPIRAVGR